eukprot:3454708-Pyramimonas_sp.AAC.1
MQQQAEKALAIFRDDGEVAGVETARGARPPLERLRSPLDHAHCGEGRCWGRSLIDKPTAFS